MKLIRNRGTDRTIDRLRAAGPVQAASISSAGLSLFGVGAFQSAVDRPGKIRLMLSSLDTIVPELLGASADRALRNRLVARSSAQAMSQWLESAQVRLASGRLPQSTIILQRDQDETSLAVTGACDLTTSGLGLAPPDPYSLTQLAEGNEARALSNWFEDQWRSLGERSEGREKLVEAFADLARRRSATEVYHRILDALFREMGESLDEERIVKSGTGIYDSAKLGQVRDFATASTIKIMVATIQSLRNYSMGVFWTESEKTGGERPADLVKATPRRSRPDKVWYIALWSYRSRTQRAGIYSGLHCR